LHDFLYSHVLFFFTLFANQGRRHARTTSAHNPCPFPGSRQCGDSSSRNCNSYIFGLGSEFGSRHGKDILDELYLLGYNAIWSCESQPMFQRNIRLHLQGPKKKAKLVMLHNSSSTLKMLATCFSETSVNFYRHTRGHIPGE
jgi:hypothetical protein